MDKKIEVEILGINSVDELEAFDNRIIENYRNNFYNELLKNENIKNHFIELFGINEEELENVLFINGQYPLDD